jgi:hypothetical protein
MNDNEFIALASSEETKSIEIEAAFNNAIAKSEATTGESEA